ncbi:hypothetical protein [Actinomyces vulturis]|uniref:hypothetical protein n=1 Tax=Actinomyces vulturis TaxID=1857645 RepID=UPI000830FCD9|nr:hypothetical protein [Actinomyces vulturis]
MFAGWQVVGTDSYFVDSSPFMATGWGISSQLFENGRFICGWYYCRDSGKAFAGNGGINDRGTGYYVEFAGGVIPLRVGWYKIGCSWYYLLEQRCHGAEFLSRWLLPHQ